MHNAFKFAIKSFMYDFRAGELKIICLSVLLATTCLTSVFFFTDRLNKSSTNQVNELLAADLVLQSSYPIEQKYIEKAKDKELNFSLYENFSSIAIAKDKLTLVAIKAVDKNYPLRGKLKIRDKLSALEYETNDVPKKGTVWLDNRLIQILNIKIGDSISLGATQFVATKILDYEPDRGGDIFNIAPRILLNRADLKKTKLIKTGSKIKYRLLLSGDIASIKKYKNNIKMDKNELIQIKDIKDTHPRIKTILKQSEQFLGIAALVSLALAGLAIAISAQYYASRHYDNCAILRCLGLEKKQITKVFFYNLLILSMVSGISGCFLGYIGQEILTYLISDSYYKTLPKPSFMPVIYGLIVSLISTMAFAFPRLLNLQHIPLLRILRRDLKPLPLNNYLIYFTGIFALVLLSIWQLKDIKITLYSLLGFFLVSMVFIFCAYLLIILIKKQKPKLCLPLRYGINNFLRRSKQNIVQITGISISISAILLLILLKASFLSYWQKQLPEKAPNYFLLNIQAEQTSKISSFLTQHIDEKIKFHPMVIGRLIKINDISAKADNYESARAKRLIQREFNLSYAKKIRKDNKIISGSSWPEKNTDKVFFSVEEGISKTLKINEGDKLTYLIAGQELSGKVINIRQVNWDSFNVNFFVIANTEALYSYPTSYIGSFYLQDQKYKTLIELTKQFSNITIIDVNEILSKVYSLLSSAIYAINFVFIFTLLIGVMILFSCMQNTQNERIHEAALMSALGAKRQQIFMGLFIEFLLLGIIAGFISVFASSFVEFLLAKFAFGFDYILKPLHLIITSVICSIIVVCSGLYGTRQALFSSPIILLKKQ